MADTHQYLAVYVPEHGGEPVALIRADLPGNHATEVLRALKAFGPVHVAATDSASFKRAADVADLFAAGTPATPAPAEVDPDAPRRAEIRARLTAEERDKRLETEVRRELASERDADSSREGERPKAR